MSWDHSAMPRERIMKIIKEKQHITVKLGNKALLKRLNAMADEGLIECKDTFKDCLYFGLPGVPWKLDGTEAE